MTETSRPAPTTPPVVRGPQITSPALLLALAFAGGIGLSRVTDGPSVGSSGSIPVLFAVSALCLLAAACLCRFEHDRSAAVLTLAGFIFAGCLSAQLFNFRLPPNHVRNLQAWGIDVKRPVTVEGVLETDCVAVPTGCEFDLNVTGVEQSPAGPHPANGRIRVQVAAKGAEGSSLDAFDLHSGDALRATMLLRRPHVSLNPGNFDFRARAANIEDLYWEASVENASGLLRLATRPAALSTRTIERIRGTLRRAIDRLYPPWSTEGRDGAVLKAILLGDRSSLDSATVDRFRSSGLYHLLVIAGLHVGLLAALVLGLLRLLRLRRTSRNLIALVVLVAYALIVEQRAPTLRATLMLAIFLVGQLLDRDHRALNSVGLAALVLLVARPAWLLESGFQLSFAAALLIVGLAAPLLRTSLEPYRSALDHIEDVERDIALPPRQAQFRLDLRILIDVLRRRSAWLDHYSSVPSRMVVWPLRATIWTAAMVFFSAILQIGLLLPMVEQFHRVTLAGVGLNALALPLTGVLLAVAVPTVLLAVIAPVVAIWPAKILSLVFRALFAIAEWPHLPVWLSYRLPSPPLWIAIGFAASLIVLALSLGRRRSLAAISSMAFAAFALMLTMAPFAPTVTRGVFGITALDCGGGEAVFLALPDGATILIGAGGTGRARPDFAPAKRWDPGENLVSPYLWSRRIKGLDALVVTSAAGNLDGFVSILENFRVRELWFGDSGSTGMARILEEAARRGTLIRPISAGEKLRIGATSFEVVPSIVDGSTARFPFPAFLISGADATALVAGNVSAERWRQMVQSQEKIQALVAAAGRTTLVCAADPRLDASSDALAVSNGPTRLSHPEAAPGTSSPSGSREFSTASDGAVTIEMKGSSVQVATYLGTRNSRSEAEVQNP